MSDCRCQSGFSKTRLYALLRNSSLSPDFRTLMTNVHTLSLDTRVSTVKVVVNFTV